MPTLVIRHPDGSEQEQELVKQLTVGRADGNDLVLVEGGVSRKHARFYAQGGDILIEDTGSANGTFVDGERINAPTRLSARAQVVIGDYEISLKGATKATSKAAGAKGPTPRRVGEAGDEHTKAQGSPKAARATKVVPAVKAAPGNQAGLAKRARPSPGGSLGPVLRGLTGPWMNKTFPLKGTMVIGRQAGNEVHIEDDSVSRRHAEVVVQGRQVILRDLGSANGTTVNGAPVAEDHVLEAGDIIQFGVVEVAFDPGGNAAIQKRPPGSAPSRSGRGARGRPDESFVPEETGSTLAPGTKKGLIIGGVVLTVLVGGVSAKAIFGEAPPPRDTLVPLGNGGGPAAVGPETPEQKIERWLAECREHSNSEGRDPDWERALEACNKVLIEEPINQDATQLLKKITLERACEDNYNKGRKLLQRNREEDALDAFGKIKQDCSYYFKARPLVKDALAGVRKRAGDECKQYVSAGQWPQAEPRCRKFMEFACQNMKPEELYPPATMKLSVFGPVRRGEWRPKDKMYLMFLQSKEKVDPGAPLWKCPEIEIVEQEGPKADPSKYAKDEFKRRFGEPELAYAMGLYFDGKVREAQPLLQKVKETREKAKWHAIADELYKDISTVQGLFNDGQNELADERPDRAAEPLTEALEVDERLVLGPEKMKLSEEDRKKELEKASSYFRRNIRQEMAQKCYEKGKGLADRQDFRAACKMWKLGYGFYKGNTDLLRAVTNVCTVRASGEFENAGDCSGLDRAAEFAVDGDGFKEKIEARKAELGCSP